MTEGSANTMAMKVATRPELTADEATMSKFNIFTLRTNQRIYQEIIAKRNVDRQYIEALETLLQQHNLNLPERKITTSTNVPPANVIGYLDGTHDALNDLLMKVKGLQRVYHVQICFKDLGYWTMSPEAHIPTVGSTMRNMFVGHGPKHRVDILKSLTGRILRGKLTLVLGPPGSGKSLFLKALCGRVRTAGKCTFEGEVTYNGETAAEGKFLLPKFLDYIEQKDSHASTLTVAETMEFAWKSTTGGHHSYGLAKNEETASLLDQGDDILRKTIIDALSLFCQMNNVIITLGLNGCRNTIVGDSMIRGVSGGQKRRVTTGEMLCSYRPIKFMDSISNGLDSATTFDIIRAVKVTAESLESTFVIGLLQPPPETFDLFDEIILLSEGQIIYHGPKNQAVSYFRGIGYDVPAFVDVADFLQELPTEEGKRFINPNFRRKPSSNNLAASASEASSRMQRATFVPRGTEALVEAWKSSELYAAMMSEIAGYDHTLSGFNPSMPNSKTTLDLQDNENGSPRTGSSEGKVSEKKRQQVDLQIQGGDKKGNEWPQHYRERYPGSFMYHFKLTLIRQYKLTSRDKTFMFSRIGQCVIVGAVAGSLFSDLAPTDTTTRSGFLFYVVLFNAFASFAMIPLCYDQKAVYYKHSDALFFPTSAFVVAQTVVLFPLQLLETIIFGVIMYWSAGLAITTNGSRFLTFQVILFVFSVNSAQLFRLFACVMPNIATAFPMAGVAVILMVLFSGFILPFSGISYGWTWFYYLNPLSWALQSITINEYTASSYDFLVCVTADCSVKKRFGDLALESRGTSTDPNYIWYGFGVIVLEYFFMVFLTALAMKYLRVEATPPPPIIVPYIEEEYTEEEVETDIIPPGEALNDSLTLKMVESDSGSPRSDNFSSSPRYVASSFKSGPASTKSFKHKKIQEIPFEPVSFSFKDIWYTVTLPDKEELDLLKGVSGYFEPGTLTALMGASGAGKTTLLDVLSGRKNTGVVKGGMFVNGKPKEERSFRKSMGYVEQFDSLSPMETARDAIEFSAALRLPRGITATERQTWVDTVLIMLELTPLENTLVGTESTGGMSFEQKKRVSIGVELAANPAILFLDEPTTGLDSRAAQVVIRNIKRVAASGRSIVCTIHQPSAIIFDSFDSLLLLQRGGQTVFFGQLGHNCSELVNYFQSAPGVTPIMQNVNPATWMLDVIGAGTSSSQSSMSFPAFYEDSELCAVNMAHTNALCSTSDGSSRDERDIEMQLDRNAMAAALEESASGSHSQYNTTYSEQLYWLFTRATRSYWRSPSYNITRFAINVVIALIFASAYQNQTYNTDVNCISRSAVIYITVFFCGVVGMQNVLPVAFSDRPAFYREQQSEMYSVILYSLVYFLVEVPYVTLASLSFTLPFFYIVGFQHVGNATAKFFWYWLFQGLFTFVMVYFGQLFAALCPSQQSAQVAMGLLSTVTSLFCGFMIKLENFPKFWTFMYYLNPLRYALEGLNMTQFYEDSTVVTTTTGEIITAEAYINSFYQDWHYSNVGYDVMALLIFIVALRVGTFVCLHYLRHEKR